MGAPVGINQQIRKMYKEDNFSPEQIAESLELDLMAVNMALAQFSDTLNKDTEGGGCNVRKMMEKHAETAQQVMAELMYSEESDAIRLKAAQTILEFAHGERDPKTVAKPTSVVTINNVIQLGNSRYEQMMKAARESKVIDA